MGTCLFLQDENTIKRIEEIKEFAQKNIYDTEESTWIPGDRPEFVLTSGTIRAVFTLTKHENELFRHLSISNKTNLPSPHVVLEICSLFGFTHSIGFDSKKGFIPLPQGTPDPSCGQKSLSKISIDVSKVENCIIVTQKIEDSYEKS